MIYLVFCSFIRNFAAAFSKCACEDRLHLGIKQAFLHSVCTVFDSRFSRYW